MANSFQEENAVPEMESLAGLAEDLVYRLPGCMDMMVRKTIQAVYRDFCRRSCCLHTKRFFSAEPNRMAYQVSPSLGGSVEAVAAVMVNGRKLEPSVDYRVEGFGTPTIVFDPRVVHACCCIHFEPTDENTDPAAHHEFFYDGHGGMVRNPCHRHMISVDVVEMPEYGCEEAPHGFITRYGDAICSGVLSRLMSMTGKPWADEAQAKVENIRYETAVSEARMNYYAGTDSGSCDLGRGCDTSVLI